MQAGHVGLWRVDGSSHNSGPSDTNEDDSEDGVLLLKPHSQYVSGMAWRAAGGVPILHTCAYDGTVRKLDLELGQFLEVFRSDDDFSGFDLTQDTNTLYVSDNMGNLHVADARTSKATRCESTISTMTHRLRRFNFCFEF